MTAKLAAILLLVISATSAKARTGDFAPTHLPPEWRQVTLKKMHFDGLIFLNSKSKLPQYIMATSIPVLGQAFTRALDRDLDGVSAARANALGSLGLKNYYILNRQVQPSSVHGFSVVDVIQAQYFTEKNRAAQTVERQYVSDDRAFVVTYITEAPALSSTELAQIEKVMDLVKPIRPLAKTKPSRGGRTPAEVDGTTEVANVGGGSQGKDTPAAPGGGGLPNVDGNIKSAPQTAANDPLCKGIPQEYLAQPGQPESLKLSQLPQGTFKMSKAIGGGFRETATDLNTYYADTYRQPRMLANLAKTGAAGAASLAEAAKDHYSKVFGDALTAANAAKTDTDPKSSQVMASVAAVAKAFVEDDSAMTKKFEENSEKVMKSLVLAVYNGAAETKSSFWSCLSPAGKVEDITKWITKGGFAAYMAGAGSHAGAAQVLMANKATADAMAGKLTDELSKAAASSLGKIAKSTMGVQSAEAAGAKAAASGSSQGLSAATAASHFSDIAPDGTSATANANGAAAVVNHQLSSDALKMLPRGTRIVNVEWGIKRTVDELSPDELDYGAWKLATP